MLERTSENPRYTYQDYVRWQGDDRWELIEGIPFDMSPAPGRKHQAVVGALFSQILIFLQDNTCRAYVAPFDVRLPVADEADDAIETVVQPDITVVCDRSRLDAAGCRGAPDWVVEVTSPRTSARDRTQKRDLYERSGVREYWIVDPERQTVLAARLDASTGCWRPSKEVPATSVSAPSLFPRLTIDWDLVFRD